MNKEKAKKVKKRAGEFFNRLLNRLQNRLRTQEKIMFAKRLSLMVQAGVPLLEALQMLKRQASSRTAKRIFGEVAADVERGQFLSTALQKFSHTFGDFAVNVIRIGEVSGTLEENLLYLADELKKKQELKRKMVGALVYPAIVVTATIALSILLTVIIFPKILPIFSSFKFELPFSTRSLIFVSGLFLNYGWYMLLGLGALIVGIIMLRRIPIVKFYMHRLTLKIPLFGKIARYYHMSNFCRTLGLLLKSQVLVVEAARITGNTMNNLVYRREFGTLSEKLLRGGKMSAHFDERQHLFAPILGQMVAVGERTGKLSDTLIYVSDMYENEVDMLTKNLSTSLEPTLMIVMGAVVGFIAVSIITPIYEVTQHIHP